MWWNRGHMYVACVIYNSCSMEWTANHLGGVSNSWTCVQIMCGIGFYQGVCCACMCVSTIVPAGARMSSVVIELYSDVSRFPFFFFLVVREIAVAVQEYRDVSYFARVAFDVVIRRWIVLFGLERLRTVARLNCLEWNSSRGLERQ